MQNNKRSISRDQKAHEVTAGRGFVLWIAAYLVLSLTFLILDYPHGHHLVASQHAGDRVSAASVVPRPPRVGHGS